MRWGDAIGVIAAFVAVLPLPVRSEPALSPHSGMVARSWQTEDGLPQNTVNAILQTRDGYLWVGTSGGLARFDGAHFRQFGLADGLLSVRIAVLAEDRQGRLWIGTTGGGVSYFENGAIRSFGTAEGFPSAEDVVSIAAGKDGAVWIGTVDGLVKWSSGAFSMIGEAEGLPRKEIRALAQSADGTLWVSVLLDGVYAGEKGTFTKVTEPGPVSGDCYSLVADVADGIWAGAGNGLLWRFRNGAWERFDRKDGLPFDSFVGLAQAADGTLWIAANNHGVYQRKDGRFAPAQSGGELSGQSVRMAAVDRDGSVWIGTNANGLRRLSARVLEYWGEQNGLGVTSVSAIAEGPDGTCLVSTESSGILQFDHAHFSPVADATMAKLRPRTYCAVATSDGSIWEAGEQFVCRMHAGEPTKTFLEAPIQGEAVRAMCADGNAVWLGTYFSTLMRCDTNGVQVVAPRGSFPGGITSMVREAGGTLWIGSAAGLYRWEHGQIRRWGKREGLLTANVAALQLEPDGTLWIGTQGGGLARLQKGRIFSITTRHGLIDDIIKQIVADGYGYLWLGTNHGIMRLARADLHELADGKRTEVLPVAFGKNEGMVKEQCSGGHSPTAIKTHDGRLLFPTVGGVAEIDPRQLETMVGRAPQAMVDVVRTDGRLQPLRNVVAIPAGTQRLEVRYSAPALRGGEWVRFRHRLDGFDSDWVPGDASQSISYERLRPDKYVLRIEARDGSGNWGAPGARLELSVGAFFWQTLWFRAGGIVLLVGACSTGAWWYTRQKHLREFAELERKRQEEAELARVSRVSLLGELSASLVHELNQPLTTILSNSQAAVRFLDRDPWDLTEVRAILKDIAAADRHASEIIGRMRAMMKKGEAQLEPRDLNADIEQVLMLLRSDLSARGVTIVTELRADLPPVSGDHIQLQQVLMNLILNGADAMQALPVTERELVIATERVTDDQVRASVKDRGTGISPEMFEQIFDAFFTTKASGLGMGLAICRAIVKAHGGVLWAANNADRGATFHFTLRLDAEEKTPSSEAEPARTEGSVQTDATKEFSSATIGPEIAARK